MSTGLRSDSRFLREVLFDSSHGVVVVDAVGSLVFSNGILETCLGFESEALLERQLDDLAADGQVLDRVREAADATPGTTVEFALRDVDGESVGMAATCEAATFEGTRYLTLWCQERRIGTDCERRDDTPEPGAIDGVAIEEVTGVWQELLDVSDPSTVAETALGALGRLLGTDVACVRVLDEESNALERLATTDHAADLLASWPAFDMHRSLAGRALRRGEPVVDRPETADERENLHVPIEDHGTISVFGTGTGLTARDVEVTERVASVVAAALDRLHREVDAQPLSVPVRDIVADAADAETRESIGQRVCERLVATDSFASAWFIETDVDGAWRAIEASAGETESPPEGARRAETGDDESDDPVGRAVETGDVCLVHRRRTVRNGEQAQTDTESVETTVVVPVAHDDRTYGVVVVQSEADTTDRALRSELGLLGDVAGLAVSAVERRKLLLSERVQQLEIEVTDPDCLAVAVSDAVGGACEIEHRTLTNDGDHLCYLHVEAPPETTQRATIDLGSVTDCRVVDTDEEGCLLEVIKTRSGAEALMDIGATVRKATADSGVGTLVVETPLSTDVREVVDAYTELNPESHLVAKREIDRSVSTADALGQRIEEKLTERQLSVLTSAYYAGYFEWPRANTAEEVADALGISPATLHQHLRAAERKLLDLVCEDEPRPAGS